VADCPVPLCTAAQFQSGPYADLASQYTGGSLDDLASEATRLCEDEIHRRLAPFTVTETHRASASDPDEYADAANLPMNIQGTLGWSYAQALETTNLVRHVWVKEYPGDKYPDMWSYSNVSVTVILSYGGTPRTLGPAQILDGPDNQGHIWFTLGQFIPVGSRLRITYSGGYNPVPAGLVRAGRFMMAYLIVRDLNPADTEHDPDQLHVDAMLALSSFEQDAD
jgi:hypothetical protein